MFSRPHNVDVCHIGVAVYCIILRLIFFTALGRVSVDCDSVPLVDGALWCWVLTVLRLVVVLGLVLRVVEMGVVDTFRLHVTGWRHIAG